MTNSDEEKLIQSVSFAANLVQQGEEPSAALLKSAREYSLQPGELRVVCNAFNTGRQNVQWSRQGDILDKLASTSLANYSAVFQQLWGKPPEEKTAAVRGVPQLQTYADVRQGLTLTGDYFPELKPPTVEKQANAHEERAAKFQNLHRLRQRLDRQRTEKSAAESRFNLHLHQLYSYFRKSAALRASFQTVKSAAMAYRGEHCASLFDHIQDRIPAKFLAGGEEKLAVNWLAEPFCHVDNLIATAREVATTQEQYDKLASDYDLLFRDAHGIVAPAQPVAAVSLDAVLDIPGLPADKSAGLVGGALGGLGYGTVKPLVAGLSESDAANLNKYVEELDAPEHTDNLRRIHSQTLLAELMSDPDNPISSYDPSQVADAYNEIVRLAPRAADQPSVISTLLQKKLLGNTEPFELGETLKIESGLKQTQSPATIDLKGGDPWT
jgi:hypothetical protein